MQKKKICELHLGNILLNLDLHFILNISNIQNQAIAKNIWSLIKKYFLEDADEKYRGTKKVIFYIFLAKI